MLSRELNPHRRFLLEHGMEQEPSDEQTKQTLACLECRWAETKELDGSPRTTGHEIRRLTSLPAGVLYRILDELEADGIIQAEDESSSPYEVYRPEQRVLRPTEAEFGQNPEGTFPVPETCPPD